MHRHGYKGKKLSRKRDQRNALTRGLIKQLIEVGSIETTLPKAKHILPSAEKLITTAKKGDLASRRLVLSNLGDVYTTNLLVDQIAPQLSGRDSGYLRIEKTDKRVGDNAQKAIIEFVDEIDYETTEATESEAVTKEVATPPIEDKKETK